MPDLDQFVRSAATDEALDNVIAALKAAGFAPPSDLGVVNRNALANALVTAAIDHELRVRIDKQPGRPTIRKQRVSDA
jgi:hypothetical protein